MESAALTQPPERRDPRRVPSTSTIVRHADRAIRRAALAARQPGVLILVVVTVASAVAASLLGMAILGQWVGVVGGALFFGCIAFHALSPAHGDALYGPLGPPVRPDVLPNEVAAPHVRAAYRAVLRAHTKIRESLLEREGTTEFLLVPYRRCGDLVRVAGRIARVANALHDHQQERDRDQLSGDVVMLQKLARGAKDAHARRAYQQTADARQRQLDSYDELCGLQERIHARLELVAASLESMQFLIVKLHARLLEQDAGAGESVSEGLDVLHDELDILEAAMDEVLYRPVDNIPPLPLDALEPWTGSEE